MFEWQFNDFSMLSHKSFFRNALYVLKLALYLRRKDTTTFTYWVVWVYGSIYMDITNSLCHYSFNHLPSFPDEEPYVSVCYVMVRSWWKYTDLSLINFVMVCYEVSLDLLFQHRSNVVAPAAPHRRLVDQVYVFRLDAYKIIRGFIICHHDTYFTSTNIIQRKTVKVHK